VVVSVHRCEGLRTAGGAAAARPYAHYHFPGQRRAHDSAPGAGPEPVFEDRAEFALGGWPGGRRCCSRQLAAGTPYLWLRPGSGHLAPRRSSCCGIES
jgi:hypothetical protein